MGGVSVVMVDYFSMFTVNNLLRLLNILFKSVDYQMLDVGLGFVRLDVGLGFVSIWS